MKIRDTIGIDVSKLKIDVHVYSSKAFEIFDNTDKRIKKMLKWALKNSEYEQTEILFVFEHTGLYSERLARVLSAENIAFSIVPGLAIKRSMGITRGKDDKIDAARIAQYGYRLRDEIKPSKLPATQIQSIKRLLTLRERLVRQRSGFKASIKELLATLLTSENKVLIKCQKQMLRVLTVQITKIEKEIKAEFTANGEINEMYKLVTSIKGIGPQIAIHLIVYSEGFTKFRTWRQFASYCGIAPFPNRSGSSIRGATKISNLANKKLKSLLDMGAKSAIQNCCEMKVYYDKRVNEGKNKRSTINIIRNKLLSRAFAVVKRKSPYVDVMKFAA